MKVSVIIPVYNAEMYLRRCLESVVNQTYKDIEVLLIDDGSTDDSYEICMEYARRDRRVKVIHKLNTGVADTRNVGIYEVRGEYVLFIDADDYVKITFIEELLNKALQDKSDMVICDYYLQTKENIKRVSLNFEEHFFGNESIRNNIVYKFYTNDRLGLTNLWNKLIKRSLFMENKVVFEKEFNRGEDAWFVFNCLIYSERVSYISSALYYYVQNSDSIMHRFSTNLYDGWAKRKRVYIEKNHELGFDINYDMYYEDFLWNTSVYIRDLIKNDSENIAFEIINDDFYKSVSQYSKYLPFHIKCLTELIHRNYKNIAFFLYNIWARL